MLNVQQTSPFFIPGPDTLIDVTALLVDNTVLCSLYCVRDHKPIAENLTGNKYASRHWGFLAWESINYPF